MANTEQSSPGAGAQIIFALSPLPGILKVLCIVLGLGFVLGIVFVMEEPGDGSIGGLLVRLAISGVLLAVVCVLLQVVLFRGYVAFDPAARELVVVSRGLIPPVWRRRFATNDVVSVRFHETHGVISPGHGELWLVPASGPERLLVLLGSEDPGPERAAAVAKAIGVDVTL
jgi:hypothetical protein